MVMRQIVKDILETESKIREILEQARQKASQTKLAAEKEASEQVGSAGQQARAIVQTEVEEARKKSQQIREETLARADRQECASLDEKKEAMADLVARICAVVLNPDATKIFPPQSRPDQPFSEAAECEMDDQ